MIRDKNAFSLIELLVVFVIISILAGISSLIYNKVTSSSMLNSSKTFHSAIENALEIYKSDHGSYPTISKDPKDATPEMGSKGLYQALTGDGINFLYIYDMSNLPEMCEDNVKSTQQFSKCGKVYIESITNSPLLYTKFDDQKKSGYFLINSFDNIIYYQKGGRSKNSYFLWSSTGKIRIQNW